MSYSGVRMSSTTVQLTGGGYVQRSVNEKKIPHVSLCVRVWAGVPVCFCLYVSCCVCVCMQRPATSSSVTLCLFI